MLICQYAFICAYGCISVYVVYILVYIIWLCVSISTHIIRVTFAHTCISVYIFHTSYFMCLSVHTTSHISSYVCICWHYIYKAYTCIHYKYLHLSEQICAVCISSHLNICLLISQQVEILLSVPAALPTMEQGTYCSAEQVP